MKEINHATRACSLILVVFMVLFSTSATAAFYKWVDENGAVHFSDQAPSQDEDDASMVDPASMGGRKFGKR